MHIWTTAAPPFYKNGYVVACDDTREAIVIDPGDDVAEQLAIVKREGVAVKMILLTHAHVDHVTGVAAARAALAVPVWLHRDDLFLYERAADQVNDDEFDHEQQSQLKLLIARGKEQGFLTYGEVNDHLPNDLLDPEQIEDVIGMINDMGIMVHEVAPDADTLLTSSEAVAADDDAAEEAAAALATVDSQFGRTTDPVRMYMREMGAVELLTREGEIKIAKRIEDGMIQMLESVASHPETIAVLLREYALIEKGEARLGDIVVGFTDINPPAEELPEYMEDEELVGAAAVEGDEEDESEEGADAESEDVTIDLEEVRSRMAKLEDLHGKVLAA